MSFLSLLSPSSFPPAAAMRLLPLPLALLLALGIIAAAEQCIDVTVNGATYCACPSSEVPSFLFAVDESEGECFQPEPGYAPFLCEGDARCVNVDTQGVVLPWVRCELFGNPAERDECLLSANRRAPVVALTAMTSRREGERLVRSFNPRSEANTLVPVRRGAMEADIASRGSVDVVPAPEYDGGIAAPKEAPGNVLLFAGGAYLTLPVNELDRLDERTGGLRRIRQRAAHIRQALFSFCFLHTSSHVALSLSWQVLFRL